MSPRAPSGYDGPDSDGCWWKVVRVRRLRCRRDHKSGAVRKGDTYTETTTRVLAPLNYGDEDRYYQITSRRISHIVRGTP